MPNKTDSIDIPKSGFVRSAEFIRDSLNDDDRTIEISISSETKEVKRWFGIEVLGHKKKEVDLSILGTGRAPLCINHDLNVHTGQVGTLLKVWIKEGRLMTLARFGISDLAKSIYERVKDGELTNISVGYRVLELLLVKDGGENELNEYRATEWQPYEASIVSIAADMNVGVGRSGPMVSIPVTKTEAIMLKENEENNRNANVNGGAPIVVPAAVPATVRSNEPAPDRAQIQLDVQTSERLRVAAIDKMSNDFSMSASDRASAISDGTTADMYRIKIMEGMKKTENVDPAAPQRADIGLTGKEVSNYSISRAVHAQLNPRDSRAQLAAAFEQECAEVAEKQSGRTAQGLMVPAEVLRAPIPSMSRSTVTVASAASAGNMVATSLAPSYIDLLYNRVQVIQMGASRFNGLDGNVDFSKFISGSNAFWVGEDEEVGEGGMGTDLVSLSPKTVGAWVSLSRRTLLQSSADVDGWVWNNIARTVSLSLDKKSLYGDGLGNTPRGVKNTAGIGAIAHGVNGAAPSWEKIIAFETEMAAANADIGSLGYITNTRVRGALKTTKKDAGSGIFLMGDGRDDNGFSTLNGYRAGITNQIASDNSKGTGTNLSDMVFGNWADLYLGFWSGLDIMANPYAEDKKGAVRITALQDVDCVVARGESFVWSNDIAA